jgi:serine/threonine protein kinase
VELPKAIGPYLIDRLVATSGTGTMWQAHHYITGVQAALLVHHARPTDAQLAEYHMTIGAVRHPSVCKLMEVGTTDDRSFLAYEWLDGPTLVTALPKPLVELAPIAVELLDGLAAIHAAGRVHGEARPENVMLADRAVWIGYALLQVSPQDSYMNIGSPSYAAPEVIQGEPFTPLADIYAFGITLFQALAGELPFAGNNFMDVCQAHIDKPPPLYLVPEALRGVLAMALAKAPSERFPDALAMRKALVAAVRSRAGG